MQGAGWVDTGCFRLCWFQGHAFGSFLMCASIKAEPFLIAIGADHLILYRSIVFVWFVNIVKLRYQAGLNRSGLLDERMRKIKRTALVRAAFSFGMRFG